LGHFDERYRRILELFVPPREYEAILHTLEHQRLVFIVGDPGIGKTYTAVRLLRHYFLLGFDPIWYAGLEKSEREDQRAILEGLRPGSRQVIYFEDPFGRTTFEDRDTMRRAFRPLLDHLGGVDARIIITSRKEIFEQFTATSISQSDLRPLAEELNVVKPSYSNEALLEIMDALAVSAKWFTVPDARSVVASAVRQGLLRTPLSIRDLVFSTEHVHSAQELQMRLARRSQEQVALFAEEMQASRVQTRLTLALAFLFGSEPLATLAAWFNAVARFIEPAREWGGTAPFFEELAIQVRYRLEQYGRRSTVLRFVHPLYEEAFARATERNSVTYEIVSSLLKYVGRVAIRTAAAQVLRQFAKYPDLCERLLRDLLPVLKATGELKEISLVCQPLLGAYDKTGNARYLELCGTICPLDELATRINAEPDLQALALGLRLVHNYASRLFSRDEGGRQDWRDVVVTMIDFDAMLQKWFEEENLAKVIPSLGWVCLLAPWKAKPFIDSLGSPGGLLRFRGLPWSERVRVSNLAGHWPIGHQLSQALDRRDVARFLVRDPQWMFSQIDLRRAIQIDEGAREALLSGNSLLPVGVVAVHGDFEREEIVTVIDETARPVAVAMASYSADEISRIRGRHSSAIEQVLGFAYSRSVIRRRSVTPVDR
jgi:predicted RNA-binding protein (TIGR00451 family)